LFDSAIFDSVIFGTGQVQQPSEPGWVFKLQVVDAGQILQTISTNNLGYSLILREKNNHSLEFTVRDIDMDATIIRGNKCRVLGDYNNLNPTTVIFNGRITDKNEKGTWNKRLACLARDQFKDRLLTKTVNKKYQQQFAGVIFKDMVQNFIASPSNEFTVNGVQDTAVKVSEDFPHFQAGLACDTLAEDTFTEYFCKGDLNIVFRHPRTEDSGLTVTEAMVKDMSEVHRSLAESVSEAIVVGDVDGSGNRIIARSIDPGLPPEIQGRKKAIQDKRFTTYQGAKLKSLSMLSEVGKDFVSVPPIHVRDITSLPRPGQLITLNIPKHNLNNLKLVVKQIQIDVEPGTESIPWIKFWFGESDKSVEERILIQQAAFERERARGVLAAETATQQLLNARDTVTITEVKGLKKCSNFYMDSVLGGDPDGCLAGFDNTKGNQTEMDV
jgi:hypothetical protein